MSKFFSDNLSLSVPSGPYWVISYTCVTKYMSSNLGSLSKVTTPMAFYALTNIVKNAAAFNLEKQPGCFHPRTSEGKEVCLWSFETVLGIAERESKGESCFIDSSLCVLTVQTSSRKKIKFAKLSNKNSMTLETNRPRIFRRHFTMILLQKEIN